MYPPDCILAPRSCLALPPEGRLWPSGDDDAGGGEEDVNQETKQEQVAVQLGPSRGLWQYSISTLDDECDDDGEDDGEERNEKQYYCSKLED